MERFEPGTAIAVRTHRLDRVRTAKAAILVEDSSCAISYWWPAGATWLVTKAMTTPRDEMFSRTLSELEQGTWSTTFVPWEQTDVLATTAPGSWAVVWHMWDHQTREFNNWYVDFKRPHTRTAVGFDTYDLDLDIVVLPDGTWSWKDRDEFDARRNAGFIADSEARAVTEAASEMVELIEAAAPPFDGSGIAWRPDPSWPHPVLPVGWDLAPLT